MRRAPLSRTTLHCAPLGSLTLCRTTLCRTSLGTAALTWLSTLTLRRFAVCSPALARLARLTRLARCWAPLRRLAVFSPTLARLSTLTLARPTRLPRLPLSATASTGISGTTAGERVLGRLVATQLDESPDCRS